MAITTPPLRRFRGRVRPLRPGDEARLQEFFRSHTPDTIHDRYGGVVTTMSEERARELVGVDQTRDCALGSFTRDGQMLLAVGRYCLDPAGDAAELAFVVRESVRRRGVGTRLLQLLMAAARARRLRRLWAQVDVHNASMLGIFRHHGFRLTPQPGSGDVRATLELPRDRRGVRPAAA
ncbi:MAG: family N-acetyltransferase [Acidobacteria bacterium]|nr:family N-acetyltransferase [Acidobacteriota bacterium]